MMKPCTFRRRLQHRCQEQRRAVDALGQLGEVVPGDQAAQRYARIHVQQRQHRGEHRAADVLEIHVDPLGRRLGEPLAQLRLAVIEARVKAERS